MDFCPKCSREEALLTPSLSQQPEPQLTPSSSQGNCRAPRLPPLNLLYKGKIILKELLETCIISEKGGRVAVNYLKRELENGRGYDIQKYPTNMHSHTPTHTYPKPRYQLENGI